MTRSDSVHLLPDAHRVITKPFLPREEINPDGSTRMQLVLERIRAMSDADAAETLATARQLFVERHRDIDDILERNFRVVAASLGHLELLASPLSAERRHLIGAYFTHEYSIEAAALGNPSMVPAPNQSGLDAGEVRFLMSLRAIGEGHLSSIEFRSGVVTANAEVRLDPVSGYARTGDRTPHAYDKSFFRRLLDGLGMLTEAETHILVGLEDRFTMAELEARIAAQDDGSGPPITEASARVLEWLTQSNYRTSFPVSTDVSERVLFPSGPTESHGMEDARFVRFVDDDGTVTYFATYTAFDGHQILPQLIETADFTDFRIATLSGPVAHNKGMAIFPRRINGQFVALGRHDNVNNFIMMSDDVRIWRSATVIQEPERPWELMQLGNCGSPLETEAGWLVITHGVGPFRRYTLGALLLDLDDPGQVIGHLDEPLLSPNDEERDGYVPNVVYSCGSMIHAGHLILPYGFADVGAGVATVRLDDLLTRLTSPVR